MLKKDLGTMQVFSIAAGAMISSGLFVLPGIVFAFVGPAVLVAYVLASILMIPTMLAQAELATAMPKSGGSYFFIERSLGGLLGTMAGLTDWVSISLKSAFALVGIGALASFFGPDFGPWAAKGVAATACILFGVINGLGARDAGRFQVWLVVLLLGILVGFIAMGLPAVESERFHPFLVSGLQSVFAMAGMVFVSYGGLTKVVSVSEEIRNPGKTIPKGMFLAFFAVNLVYVLVLVVVVGTVPSGRLAGSLVPLNLSAEVVAGRWASWALSLAAFLAFATTANAGILSASRSPMAMSRDGLLPSFLARTHPKFGTPSNGILLTVSFMVATILFLPLETLVKTASTMMILMFILVNVSLLVVRRARLPAYRPIYRVPFYPWLPLAAILAYGFLILEMGFVPLLLTGVFALFSMAWFLGYVRRRIDRESAFIHLAKRMTAREVKRPGLEDELRQIALGRDEHDLDWFDHLVHDCPVLDIEETISGREFFRKIACLLSERLGLSCDDLYTRFLDREKDSSTVIEPGIAIPHVVVEGEGIVELVLVRARPGIVFSDLHPPVHTAFVLAGSKDTRTLHLRALMAIAHIVEEREFRARWLDAIDEEQLRDLVLLAERRRFSG